MITGNCLCGGVRFEVDSVPLIVLCHCSICRRANGAAFESGATVPVADYRLVAGSDLIQAYESSPGVRRDFCRTCGCRVPSPSEARGIYFVPAGLLNEDPGVKPSLHLFAASKAPWWDITDELPQHAGMDV